ncbi:peptide chain release factor 1 [Falsiroseomonas oryzae]|uniref:peptide chain release factor 1 n=1 Tax=Falsiroseomonas oryzae TaxID=2766473 RepID=UPI0022EAA30D|nr:peptide chain release factor 1 [Roseomonas sp. MO-31]
MTEREIETKLAELDRLLNDPDTRMDPHKVWSLLAEVSGQLPKPPRAAPAGG